MQMKRNPKFLVFSHKKLSKKARAFRHEIQHLTGDLLNIDRKINRNLSVCEGIIKILGSEKQGFRAVFPRDDEDEFHELLYHLENFIFRLHAYRDKICIFINLVMKLGYSGTDMGLIEKLLEHGSIRKFHLDTELKKFSREEFLELLKTRKSMSHQVYYETYDPYFMPDTSPKDVGFYKAALTWRRKIKKEVSKINNCMEQIFEINERLSEKLLAYLNTK